MSIKEFSQAMQQNVWKSFLENLGPNSIANKSAKDLRSSQEISSKTDFLITQDTLAEMYQLLSGKKADLHDIQAMMQELSGKMLPQTKRKTSVGKFIKIGNKQALLFENINFDTITAVLKRVLNTGEIENHLHDLEIKLQEKAKEELKLKYGSNAKIPKEEWRKAESIKVTLGSFFHKGHVIGVSTNLSKQLLQEIEKTDALAKNIKDELINVMRQYISRMEKDDLESANIKNAAEQEIYAKYIKSPDKYLVEMQIGEYNASTGSDVSPIASELKRLITGLNEEALKNLRTNNRLGETLVFTEGSPSYAKLIAYNLVNIIEGSTKNKIVYTVSKTKIASQKIPIVKPKKHTEGIKAAKSLLNKLKNIPDKSIKSQFDIRSLERETTNLTNFQVLLNAKLHDQIRQNMGSGERRDILNYRTGRFAHSANVEKVSQSREGMITAFYSYMKNPYATFSEGGKQQYPRSRDPKLLISRSIREIAQTMVSNKLRAVNV